MPLPDPTVTVAFHALTRVCPAGVVQVSVHPLTAAPRLVIVTVALCPVPQVLSTL